MRYNKVNDGDIVRPKMSGWKLMCCDCGLVHQMKFRVIKGQVEFVAMRDYRATAAARRDHCKKARKK